MFILRGFFNHRENHCVVWVVVAPDGATTHSGGKFPRRRFFMGSRITSVIINDYLGNHREITSREWKIFRDLGRAMIEARLINEI
jgi:hypothetical protein